MENLKELTKNSHRLEKNPAEAEILELFDKVNKYGGFNKSIIDYILGGEKEHHYATDEEKKAAYTVIQWLATPVGIGFLREVIELKGIKEYLK